MEDSNQQMIPYSPRTRLIEAMEESVQKTIIMAEAENEESLSRCNAQEQSPFFSMLPREIRDLIWAFATAPYEVEEKRYDANEYYCRPGHTAPLKTDFWLLLTCRRVWLEANPLPMLQAEHCFWYYRAAPDARNPEWMASLTRSNRKHFGLLHLFPQMFAIEGLRRSKGRLRGFFLRSPESLDDFQPRVMQVTVRHTDWWNWEHEAPLRLEKIWLQAMLDTEDLRRTQILKLDLETLDYKVDQLMPIVERLKQLESREIESHLVDGKPTKTKFVLSGEPQVQTWSGPTDIDGGTFHQYEEMNSLNYHIVTLTWKLHFLDYPRGHVPTLRLAPRLCEFGMLHSPPKKRNKWQEVELPPPPQLILYHVNTSEYSRRQERQLWREGRLEIGYHYLRMMNNFIHTEKHLQYRADMHERLRRAQFLEQMGRIHAARWEGGWDPAGSLLRLEE